jgi:hypothetical protein
MLQRDRVESGGAMCSVLACVLLGHVAWGTLLRAAPACCVGDLWREVEGERCRETRKREGKQGCVLAGSHGAAKRIGSSVSAGGVRRWGWVVGL